MQSESKGTHPAHTGKPSSPRRELTRDKLLAAAMTVFSSNGVHASSIEQICEAAGFTRGAFYSNFETKEELFFALITKQQAAVLESLAEALNQQTSGFTSKYPEGLTDSVIAQIVETVLAIQFADPRLLVVLTEFRLFAYRDQVVAERLWKTQQDFHAQIAEVLVSAMHSVGIKFRIDPLVAIRLLMHVYEDEFELEFLTRGQDIKLEKVNKAAARIMPSLIRALTN